MKVYLAGPLFTSAERQWNVELAKRLRIGGLNVWLPQENEPRKLSARAIFDKDVEGVDWADAVVAIMDGPDPDSGTSWEVGYAYARNKPIFLVRTDIRGASDSFALYNLMLTESATRKREIPFATNEETAETILRMIENYFEVGK